MHPLTASLAFSALLAASLLTSATPAQAATLSIGHARCLALADYCIVIAQGNADRGGSQRTRQPVKPHHDTSAAANPCRTHTASPQPPKSDPAWAGHSTGTILVEPCWLIQQMGAHDFWAVAPAKKVSPTTSPQILARRAFAELRIPRPVLDRSPDATTEEGRPMTWVNLWTWVWTSPQSWRALSKRASSGAVWATVTVTPKVLTFAPGIGERSVTCPGPGRPWAKADGDAAPSEGGCGYQYPAVFSNVSAKLSIRWAVAWHGSDGTHGSLPSMTTTAGQDLSVEQIQVVNR